MSNLALSTSAPSSGCWSQYNDSSYRKLWLMSWWDAVLILMESHPATCRFPAGTSHTRFVPTTSTTKISIWCHGTTGGQLYYTARNATSNMTQIELFITKSPWHGTQFVDWLQANHTHLATSCCPDNLCCELRHPGLVACSGYCNSWTHYLKIKSLLVIYSDMQTHVLVAAPLIWYPMD
jgi:hypothetical protein